MRKSASTLIVLVTFVFTTLIHEPASLVTMVVIVALSMAPDFAWKRSRAVVRAAIITRSSARSTGVSRGFYPPLAIKPSGWHESGSAIGSQ
jgi:hypothetical protein